MLRSFDAVDQIALHALRLTEFDRTGGAILGNADDKAAPGRAETE